MRVQNSVTTEGGQEYLVRGQQMGWGKVVHMYIRIVPVFIPATIRTANQYIPGLVDSGVLYAS